MISGDPQLFVPGSPHSFQKMSSIQLSGNDAKERYRQHGLAKEAFNGFRNQPISDAQLRMWKIVKGVGILVAVGPALWKSLKKKQSQMEISTVIWTSVIGLGMVMTADYNSRCPPRANLTVDGQVLSTVRKGET